MSEWCGYPIADGMHSESERNFRARVRDFVKAEASPLIDDAYSRGEFPRALIPKLGAEGFFGATLPRAFGGGESDYRIYGIICQELERGDSAIRSFVSVQSALCMHAIYRHGDDSQRAKWLPMLAGGESVGCFALTESGAGSDPSAMQTMAEKRKDGWSISGHKRWCTNATLANVAVIWAQTKDGIRGFLIEADRPGFSARPIAEEKLSLRMSHSGEIILDDCRIPHSAILPGSEIGLRAALECLTQARLGICWGAIGAAMSCYESALSHAKSRRQFGSPLAAFQLTQARLADMHADIIKSQLLNFRLADLMNLKQCDSLMVGLGKREACRAALRIARDSRDLLGAEGILLSRGVMRHLCNLETVVTYEGADAVHTLSLGRKITGENAFRRD